MSEELFWAIYFTLVKTLLPPEAFAAPCPPSEAPSNSVEAPGLPLSSGGMNLPARVRRSLMSNQRHCRAQVAVPKPLSAYPNWPRTGLSLKLQRTTVFNADVLRVESYKSNSAQQLHFMASEQPIARGLCTTWHPNSFAPLPAFIACTVFAYAVMYPSLTHVYLFHRFPPVLPSRALPLPAAAEASAQLPHLVYRHLLRLMPLQPPPCPESPRTGVLH